MIRPTQSNPLIFQPLYLSQGWLSILYSLTVLKNVVRKYIVLVWFNLSKEEIQPVEKTDDPSLFSFPREESGFK